MTDTPSAPEWTDFTPSDPGITLLEVLAYSVAALLVVGVVRSWRRARRPCGACGASPDL